MNDEFLVLLKAVLDKSGIKADLQEIQKLIDKIGVDIEPDVDTKKINQDIKSILKNLTSELNIKFGTSFDVKDIEDTYKNAQSAIENSATQMQDSLSKVSENGMLSGDTSGIQQQIDAQNTLQEEIKETETAYKSLKKGMSLEYFTSNEDYEKRYLLDDGSINPEAYKQNCVSIIEEGNKIAADAEIVCARATTAVNRFFTTFGNQVPQLQEWCEEIRENVGNGIFSGDYGLASFGVEQIGDENEWYVFLNVAKDAELAYKNAEEHVESLRQKIEEIRNSVKNIFPDEVTENDNLYGLDDKVDSIERLINRLSELSQYASKEKGVWGINNEALDSDIVETSQLLNGLIKATETAHKEFLNVGREGNGISESLQKINDILGYSNEKGVASSDTSVIKDQIDAHNILQEEIKETQALANETNVSSGNVPQNIEVSVEETQHLVDAQEQLKEASLGVAEANEKLQQSAEDTASSFESEGKSAEGISSSTDGIKEKMDAAASSMRDTTKASEELEKAVKGVSGSLNVPITIDSGESNMFDAEIRKIVEAAEEANRTITNIDAYTKSETKLLDPSDATAGIETIKKLDKAIVTYTDDAGKASKAVYELVTMSAQDDEGNMTSQEYWVESSSKFVQNYQKGTSEIEKVMSARNKAIVNLTNKVTTSLQNAENASTKNTISDVHLDEIRESYSDIISMINDLSSINSKSDIDEYINKINIAINEMGNAFSGFKAKDTTAGSLKPNTIQTEFSTLSASLDVLKAKVKSSGVEISEDLQKYMDDASAVINKGFDPDDSGMSKTLQKLRDDIKMARAELSALSAEDAGANKTSILENNKSIAKDNLTAYQDSLKELGLLTGDTEEKVQELFQSLDHVSNSSGLTEWRSQLKAVQAQLKDTIADAKNSKASEVKITGWEEQIHDLQQVQTQTTAYKDKLALLIQKVNEYKSLDVFGTDKEKASALSSEINKLANELNKGVLTGGKYAAENSKGVLTNYSDIEEAKAAYKSLGYTITTESDNAFVAINKAGKATKTFRVTVGETNDEIRSLSSTDYGKGVVTQINGMQWALNGVLDTAKRFVGLYLSPYRIVSAIKESVSVLKEFDSALTQISYTMDMSQTQIDNLGESILTMANNLGTSVDDAMEVAAIYANMKTTSEEIQELAQPALILSNLTGSGASQMADSIQAVKNAFGDAVGDAEHIADVMDYVSQNIALDYATGINDISEAVEVAGASAEAAGVSFEQLSSIVGVTAETTRQQGSQIGNALKTIFVRLSKASNLDETIDNETLSNASKALHNIGVEVYESSGEFREFDVIMSELADRWDDLSEAEQADIICLYVQKCA